jgi:hypothetical protein
MAGMVTGRDTWGKENDVVAGARVQEINGHDWKVQSIMKGPDLKTAWLNVVAGNSI